MAVHVRGTGVIVREATAAEIEALARWRRGVPFGLAGSYSITDEDAPGTDEVPVVATAFVESDDRRWTAADHHGRKVPAAPDETLGCLRSRANAHRRPDVTRWALLSAPRRIEPAPGLAARLAPLRRG